MRKWCLIKINEWNVMTQWVNTLRFPQFFFSRFHLTEDLKVKRNWNRFSRIEVKKRCPFFALFVQHLFTPWQMKFFCSCLFLFTWERTRNSVIACFNHVVRGVKLFTLMFVVSSPREREEINISFRSAFVLCLSPMIDQILHVNDGWDFFLLLLLLVALEVCRNRG